MVLRRNGIIIDIFFSVHLVQKHMHTINVTSFIWKRNSDRNSITGLSTLYCCLIDAELFETTLSMSKYFQCLQNGFNVFFFISNWSNACHYSTEKNITIYQSWEGRSARYRCLPQHDIMTMHSSKFSERKIE